MYKELVVKYYKNHRNKHIQNILTTYNISNGSLYNWIHLANDGMLHNKKSIKRKEKLTANMKCFIQEYVLSKPSFNYKILLQKIYEKYQTKISKTLLYDTLKKLNLTRKKIRMRYIIKNEIKHNRDKKTFFKQIQKTDMKNIVSIDESSFDNQLAATYGWAERGIRINKKKHIKKIMRYSLICAISYKKIIYSKLIIGSVNAISYKIFIEELLIKLNNKKFCLLMDNAPIHHAKIVKDLIATYENKVIYNVPYMPEYNPIEQVFSKLKSLVRQKINNHIPKKLKKNIYSSLKQIKKKDLINFYKNSFITHIQNPIEYKK